MLQSELEKLSSNYMSLKEQNQAKSQKVSDLEQEMDIM